MSDVGHKGSCGERLGALLSQYFFHGCISLVCKGILTAQRCGFLHFDVSLSVVYCMCMSLVHRMKCETHHADLKVSVCVFVYRITQQFFGPKKI